MDHVIFDNIKNNLQFDFATLRRSDKQAAFLPVMSDSFPVLFKMIVETTTVPDYEGEVFPWIKIKKPGLPKNSANASISMKRSAGFTATMSVVLMPKVMDALLPHMIDDLVPLVTQPMIDYLTGKAK